MDGMRRMLLVFGIFNVVVLGLIAWALTDLAGRVNALEARSLLQQQVSAKHQAFLDSQLTLNLSYQDYMSASQEHTQSVNRTLDQHAEAMTKITGLLHDLLKKTK